MIIDIPYGPNHNIPLEISAANLTALVRPRECPTADQSGVVLRALEQPFNSRRFKDFLRTGKETLVIVNDASRPTPTALILGLLGDLAQDFSRLTFLVATGVHRPPDHRELSFIFGSHMKTLRDRIFVHDGRREKETVKIGTTRRGTEVMLNDRAVKAKKIICVSSVEPHYFAGYTGGRKSFLPGIAARKAVEQNHRHAMDPQARLLVLRGNPVHEDMMESLKFLADKEIFSIQTVLDRERKIFACAAGHIRDSFSRAVYQARRVYCRPIPARADIVLTVARFPMDIDLYQSQKAVENGKLALRKGGILILVSPCRDGIGDRAYYDRLTAFKNPAALLKTPAERYELGFHKSLKFAELMAWADVWAVTGLPAHELEAIFIRPFPRLQEALDAALKKKGPKAKVLVLLDGSVTVPIVQR
jgi:nickel-dependent lactate racemase